MRRSSAATDHRAGVFRPARLLAALLIIALSVLTLWWLVFPGGVPAEGKRVSASEIATELRSADPAKVRRAASSVLRLDPSVGAALEADLIAALECPGDEQAARSARGVVTEAILHAIPDSAKAAEAVWRAVENGQVSGAVGAATLSWMNGSALEALVPEVFEARGEELTVAALGACQSAALRSYKESIAFVWRCSNSESVAVRVHSVKAVSRSGAQLAERRSALQRLAADPHPAVASRATAALGVLD